MVIYPFLLQSLPKILDNYKNPCWFEEVPNEFTYNSSFFYRYYRAGFGQLPHGDWVVTFKNMENRIQYRKRQSRDGKGWRLRCYPYYFVLGFTKAGTTDYCRILHLFPSVFSGIKKEPQYWNKIRSVQTLFPTGEWRVEVVSTHERRILSIRPVFYIGIRLNRIC